MRRTTRICAMGLGACLLVLCGTACLAVETLPAQLGQIWSDLGQLGDDIVALLRF